MRRARSFVDPVAGTDARSAALVAAHEPRSAPRAELLRWFLRQHHLRPPSTARLAAMHDQLVRAAPDARVRLVHSGAEIGIHRNRIVVHPPALAAFEIPWRGEPRLALPHGTLEFAEESGEQRSTARSASRSRGPRSFRSGGERIQLAPGAPTRALKRILQEAGMPIWLRDSLPLVFCGDALAVVPGIGVAAAFRADPDAAGYVVNWRPAPRGD
jgi:tRNA(Ile)-lysidine synthase